MLPYFQKFIAAQRPLKYLDINPYALQLLWLHLAVHQIRIKNRSLLQANSSHACSIAAAVFKQKFERATII